MSRPATEHYGIVEYGPQGTEDPMDVYTVYNQAMITIDGILFEHEGEIAKLKKRMDDAEGRLGKLETRMDNAETEINELKKRMTTAETNIENLQNELAEFKTDVNDQFTEVNKKIDNINSQIEQINTSITNLNSNTKSIWQAIRNVIAKFFGGGSVSEDTGDITWGQTETAALGNINIFSGSGYIRTRTGEQDNDIKVI